MKQKRLSQEEVEKIRKMKEEGKSQKEIAEELDINQSTVSRNMQTENFPSAPSPETESSNVIKAPIEFKKPPVQNEVPDDYPMLGFDRFLRGSSPHLSNLDR